MVEYVQRIMKRAQNYIDDAHWDTTLADAALTARPPQIRALFAIVLTTCFPATPHRLWEKYKDSMSEDILHASRIRLQNPDAPFSDAIYNDALIQIEDICMLINNVPLINLGMPSPNRPANDLLNTDLQREHMFDVNDLNAFVQTNEPKLLTGQKNIYDTVMHSIAAQQGGFCFLDAPGGTGKTFLISLILAKVRSNGNVALALASSGIAATLLDGGRTAHSALKLPLNIQSNENAMCNIKQNSGMAKVLQQCKIIVWDECTMAHKYSLEALDRTLKDLRNNDRLFGGALLLLSGDFRQTLPVIPRSTYADEINACLKSSSLWRNGHTVKLTTNMRIQLQNDASADRFAKQLLDIGNGKMPYIDNSQLIAVPNDFCTITATKDELIASVFPDIAQRYRNHQWLSERAILAAKNIDVDALNTKIQEKLPGLAVTFKSIDTVIEEDDVVNYPTEFLNSLDLAGLPPHLLELKVGSPIILLRNINAPRLCNGTRLVVKKIMSNIIEATILNGKFKGEHVLLPRIPMIPNNTPFQFKRLQFPIRLAFAMTINKSQGQSLQICGLDLDNPCFSHGQFYVGCSRVGKPSDLFIHAQDAKTTNIVHQLALR